MPNTSLETRALKDVSFELKMGKFITIIGHTGSGKSTLMQMFNALLKPSTGQIEIAGYKINAGTSNKHLKDLRKKVSLAFQFPESQLFESTVLKDIEFGPNNFGYSEDEAKRMSIKWAKKMGLSTEVLQKSPFELSGGQMRRVALAGVIAYEPEILCLDEPAAGLDPQGRKEIMSIFKNYQKQGHTVILVTHNMEDVANYADDVLVMENGKLIKHETPRNVFKDSDWLKKHYLDEPIAAKYANDLSQKGFVFRQKPITLEQLTIAITQNLEGEVSE